MEYRNPEHKLLLELCASLTLADHIGDVSEEVAEVLNRLGMKEEAGVDWEDQSKAFAKLGITTLHGTSLGD